MDYLAKSEIILINKKIPNTGKTTNEILLEFTLEIAKGELSLIDCQEWFKGNIKKLNL